MPTREEVAAARARLGLAPARPDQQQQRGQVGFQKPPFEPLPPPKEGRGRSSFSRVAQGFRAVVPQSVRDAFGFAVNELDKPIAERLGVQVPDLPGPFDEAANFAIDELTRPSTLLIAAGGAGLAAKAGTAARVARAAGGPVSRAARAGEIAGGFIAPAGGSNFASRALAEGVLSAGARGASEAVQEALPEGTPTPARVLLGLGAGVVGGAGAIGATRAGVRAAVGRDVLAPDIGAGLNAFRPRVTSNIPDAAPRRGNLLRLPTAESIKSTDDIQQFVHTTNATVSSSLQTVVGRIDAAARELGIKPGTTEDVVLAGIRDQAGNPARLGSVLEFPDRFTMSPRERQAVDKLRAIRNDVAAEPGLYGRPVEVTRLEPGQEFWPRSVVEDKAAKKTGKGRGIRFIAEKERVHTTYDAGVSAGVKYQNPIEAMKDYAARQLSNAAETNSEDVFKTAKALDAVRQSDLISAELTAALEKLSRAVQSKRKVVVGRQARAGTLASVERSQQARAAAGLGRVEKSAGRAEARAEAAPTTQDLADARDAVTGYIAEGRELSTRIRGSIDQLRPLQRTASKQDAAILRELDALEKQMADAELSGDFRQVDVLRRRIGRLGEQYARLEDRLDTAILKGETLKEMDAVSRVNLVDARRAERQMFYLDKLSAKAEVELKQLEREQARLNATALRAGEQTAAMRAAAAKSGAEFDALRDGLRNVRERIEWQKVAIQNRPDRAVLPQEIAPGLRGYDFPTDVAERIVKTYREGEPPRDPQLGNVVRGYKDIVRNSTAVTAIGDASSLGNQLALFAVSHPVTFTKNMAASIRDAFQPKHYEQFLAKHGQDGAAHGLAILGPKAEPTEFQFTGWVSRLPFFKQAQQFFEASTTRNRVDIYNSFVDIAEKSGEPLTDIAKEQIARSLNRFSGISNTKAGQVETLTEFAANYMRSSLETIASAAVDGTLEGSLARQYMRNLVALGQMVVATAASGVIPGFEKRDMEEVLNPLDLNALKRGEVKMNSNFGTIRAFGQDVSVYGRFDSLARLVTVSADAATRAISEQDAAQLFDAIGYAAGTKGTVPIRILTDAIKGHTFGGQDPLTVSNIALSLTPFSFSAFIQDLREGQPAGIAAAGAGVSFLGGKANPLTTTERLNNVSRALYGRDLDEITPGERQRMEQDHPALARAYQRDIERRAESGDKSAQARIEDQKVDAKRIEDERSLNLKYRAGEISGDQFRDAVELVQAQAAAKKQQTEEVLKPDRLTQAGPKLALSEWYDTYRKAEKAPGVVDWDLRDSLEVRLFERIDSGEFGDPDRARAMIDDRKKTSHPDLQWYFDAKQVISESGYYDIPDRRFAPLKATASRIAGRPVESYSDLTLAAETAATAQKKAALRQLVRRVDSVAKRDKELLRLRNRDVDDALVLARGLTPIRQQRR